MISFLHVGEHMPFYVCLVQVILPMLAKVKREIPVQMMTGLHFPRGSASPHALVIIVGPYQMLGSVGVFLVYSGYD